MATRRELDTERTRVPLPIVIATIMRERRETGVQTHFLQFRDYLAARGIEARIVTPFMFPKLYVYPVFAVRRVLDPLHGSASVWWYQFWHYVFLKQVLRRVLRTRRPLVVYAQCPLSARAALETRTSPNQKVFMAVQFNISQADEWVGAGKVTRDNWLYRRIQTLEREVLPRLDGIVYVSRFMRETVERRIPEVCAVRSELIPNFVGPPEPLAQPEAHGDLISIGSLEPRKNQAYLLRVLAAASARGRSYTLTLIGAGSQHRQLKRLAHELRLDQQVRFLGFRADAARLLPGHRAYVHAATMENLSVTLLEALASHIPVFAAPVGGTPEIFSDGVEGVYWSLDDPVEGANKLIELLEDEPRYARMKAAAASRVQERFAVEPVAGRLTDFLSGASHAP